MIRLPIRRRRFLRLVGVSGLGSFANLAIDWSTLRRIFYRMEDLVLPSAKMPLRGDREEAQILSEGYRVSVETALNSRCTSDYDGNPRKFHWGMFDETKRLTEAQVRMIVDLARIPRLTDGRVEMQARENEVIFLTDNRSSGLRRDWMMVESGMQQQALGLICAAFGIGMVFSNLGVDGTRVSDADYATIKVKVDPMKPTYGGRFWTDDAQELRLSAREGSLPEPRRSGGSGLTATLQILQAEERGGRPASEKETGQLLWAARGRTPHYYKSRPWGMTVPSWGGEEKISSVFLVSPGKVSKYVNWCGGEPAHCLEEVSAAGPDVHGRLLEMCQPHNRMIVQVKHENQARALWEVGYGLLNLMLQAKSMGLAYKTVLLDDAKKRELELLGFQDAVCAFAITRQTG